MQENKQLLRLLRRVVDKNKDIDIPALHDQITKLVLENMRPASADRDGYNNPTWDMMLPITITRQDNSLTMTEELASFTTGPNKRVIGRVGRTPTGYIFTISDHLGTTITLNCRKAIEWIFSNRAFFKKTRKKKLKKPEVKEAA